MSRRSPDLHVLGAIFVGGALGALARAGLTEGLPHESGSWPWSTFVANVAGAALLGWTATRLAERLPPSTYRRPFVGTGFCGALTTFSTLQLELVRMLEDGHVPLALGYAATSLALGLAAVWLTTALVRRGGLA